MKLSREPSGVYDVVVVGGGHAGIEASVAAARLGAATVLFTMSLDALGNLPCNPNIGGTAKGHLVREIDALGGCMAILADQTTLQSRMLNKGKGPAVHSLRVQADRAAYHQGAKRLLERTEGLEIKQAEITEIIVENNIIIGVKTRLGEVYHAKTVILATGTYLGGRIYIGEASYSSGPDHVAAASALTDSLRAAGIKMKRFKTGTPARVHRRSIDFSRLERQRGDETTVPFSFLTGTPPANKIDCYIAYTNQQTHKVIRDNLHRSPLYGGEITGIGPRYCPSIEDKVVRFSEKEKHQIFVEPCGLETDEMYLQGMSSSLPVDVQIQMYRTIEGFEKLEIMRPAYAIEYDCADPLQLKPTLEFMQIVGLYGAGQFNGTSGYEEAAAQGLLAGINAARKIRGKSEIILPRQQSYIGTLVDDLVTKGVSDPYRMMTSRSEYRLYLRQDNADERLTPLGRKLGLVDDERFNKYKKIQEIKNGELVRLKKTRLTTEHTTALQDTKNGAGGGIRAGATAVEVIKRPEIGYRDVAILIGLNPAVDDNIAERIEIEIKYEGYINRQLKQIQAVNRQEGKRIPLDFNYDGLQGLRLEAREKLAKVRPVSLGQASRVPGVSPSDVAQLALALAVYAKRASKDTNEEK